MRAARGRKALLLSTSSMFGALLFGALLFGRPAPAFSQTLDAALAQAYASNPTLDAARAQLRATDELVPQALSNYRPTVTASGSIAAETESSNTTQGNADGSLFPRSASLSVSEPLYRGGRTEAQVHEAENQVQAQRASLVSTEQTVLLNASTAYLDVVLDQAIVDLDINNEKVLAKQLESTRDEFRVGQVTRTDVSQAESRLAGATATRIQAQGQLSTSQAVYAQVVGSQPGRLAFPQVALPLPPSRDEAAALAQKNNPAVLNATFNEAAARYAISVNEGALLPTISLQGSLNHQDDETLSIRKADSAQIGVQASMPLYEAGATTSQIRQAKQTASQDQLLIDQARRSAVQSAFNAWDALATARSSITADQAQVTATQIALDGVRQEAAVGSRTVLDVLNAEQEYLNAQVALVTARHDELAARFQLLSAVGDLSARALRLPVSYYDPEANYKAQRNKWWGLDIGSGQQAKTR